LNDGGIGVDGDAAPLRGSTCGVSPPVASSGVPVRQFVTYLFVGGVNTAVGYGLFAVFLFAGLHYSVAALCSTVLGVLFNFQTIGRIVFGSRDPSLVFRFVAVYVVVYLMNVVALRVLEANRAGVLAVQAVLVLPLAALSFVLHRRFVFRRKASS
jgi:putative flippase GtrA